MPIDLPTEQRDEFEDFIRQADEVLRFQPAWVQTLVMRARRMAELVLRLAGPDGTPANSDELDELTERGSPVPWSWVERDLSEYNRQLPDNFVPRTPIERLHARQKRVAEAAARSWVGKPAVAQQVDAVRQAFDALAWPLAMPDQLIITLVTARFLDGASQYPDGSEWVNPFDGAPPELVELARRSQGPYVAQLRALARAIDAAGVAVDPDDPAVLLALAQIVLLHVDLARPAAKIVDDLNIWPPGYINREAAALGHVSIWASRHGHSVRFNADLTAGARGLARRLGPRAIRVPYAGGQKRQPPAATRRLRQALSDLVRQDPTLSPAQLLALVGGADHPSLGDLRRVMGWETPYVPDLRTLERNWPK